jgi:hypothetical protein
VDALVCPDAQYAVAWKSPTQCPRKQYEQEQNVMDMYSIHRTIEKASRREFKKMMHSKHGRRATLERHC